jgi:hypothetical protein
MMITLKNILKMENKFIVKDNKSFLKCRELDPYISKHKGFISGGCFKDIFSNKKFRDIDIFFETKEDFNETLDFYRKNKDYLFVYENNNAVCFSNKFTKKKIELVRSRFCGVEEMLRSFDFTIVKFAYYKEVNSHNTEWKCMYHPNFFEDLTNKKLVIDETILSPIKTFERTYKYTKYGFDMCRETKKKLIELLQGVNVNDLSKELYFESY